MGVQRLRQSKSNTYKYVKLRVIISADWLTGDLVCVIIGLEMGNDNGGRGGMRNCRRIGTNATCNKFVLFVES